MTFFIALLMFILCYILCYSLTCGHCIADYYYLAENIENLFQRLTNGIGFNKYFLGIDATIIDAINRYDSTFFGHVGFDKDVIIESNSYLISDADGVIIATSFERLGDTQIEKMLPEEEVYERLKLIVSYIDKNPHECGAPCTSKGIEGKPCEKLTFREHCYFHRK